MTTHFQGALCHLLNMKGRDLNERSDKYEILIVAIRRASLDKFWSREPVTVRVNLTMIRNMGAMAREEIRLEYCFPTLGHYLIKDEVGMGVACVALRISLRRGRYVGNIQWDSMRKGPTAWVNLYGAGVLVLGDTINSRDGEKLKETVCPTRGPWFGNFMRGSKLWMGVINKQDFGVINEMVKALLEVWEVHYRR